MILKQYFLGCLAQASYLVACEATRTAVVVDPRRDVGEYLDEAKRLGVEIRHVILTHFHADFVAGHQELHERCGATIHLGAKARADYPFHPLADGDALELGQVRLVALETPGHTPEGISLVVYDLAKDAAKPHAVLTGDTLFLGDVGRPDLMASVGVTAEELAGQLYDSIHAKLLPLPDETLVYPGHGAGSLCGKSLSKDTVSPLGVQRLANPMLKPMSKEEFVALVTSEQPKAPAYFPYDARLNRTTLATGEPTAIAPLSIERALELAKGGAVLVDVREPDHFAAGHLAGSVNIGLSGTVETWAGTVLEPGVRIVLVAPKGMELEAAMRLRRIGFDDVPGFVDASTLASRPDLLRRWPRITVADLATRLAATPRPFVLDVRTEGEFATSRIEGTVNVPLQRLRERLSEVPRDRTVSIHCRSGYRSSVAASLLARAGVAALEDVEGGIVAWEAAKLPVLA